MLRPIPPKDLIFEWERVRAGLVEVKKATTDDWLPEDVYMSIKQGGAALYIGESDQGGYLGFVVLRLVPTFHSSKLHIWAAHSATSIPMMTRFLPEIEAVASAAGAASIFFESARLEWARVADRLGFRARQTSYEFFL
jgi:hypothetical protein